MATQRPVRSAPSSASPTPHTRPPAHEAGLGVKGSSVYHLRRRPTHTRHIVLIGCRSSLDSEQGLAGLQEEDVKAQESENGGGGGLALESASLLPGIH